METIVLIPVIKSSEGKEYSLLTTTPDNKEYFESYLVANEEVENTLIEQNVYGFIQNRCMLYANDSMTGFNYVNVIPILYHIGTTKLTVVSDKNEKRKYIKLLFDIKFFGSGNISTLSNLRPMGSQSEINIVFDVWLKRAQVGLKLAEKLYSLQEFLETKFLLGLPGNF